MQIKTYNVIPKEAKHIRNEVFVKEQGFVNEFDEIDKTATHFVLFDGCEKPVATCRVFRKDGSYILGRLAVLKDHRKKHYGSLILKEAEEYVGKSGGKSLLLHSQCRIKEFYKKLGYAEFGEIGYDEDCPHIWMKKTVTFQ